jgi:hypothetical protein
VSEALGNLEMLLREALAPVEPPADLIERVESTLESITAFAAEELEAWELAAMRDPRNWVRPAAAIVAGGAAGGALVILQARRRAQHPPDGLALARDAAERALADLRSEARRLFRAR